MADKKTQSRKGNSKNNKKQVDAKKNEIYLFVFLAVTVFLFCSNFGWCGVFGNFFSNILFGLFGSIEYALPIYMFLSAAFLLSNGALKPVVKRVLCVAIFLVAIAFICQLVNGVDVGSVKELYNKGAKDKQGGGVILGGLLILIHKAVGMTGSIIVISLMMIIGIIIVMDVSIIGGVKSRLAHSDHEDEYDGYESSDKKINVKQRREDYKDKNMLNNIKVLEGSDKKKGKKAKNKVCKDEEVHELKPVYDDSIFDVSDYPEMPARETEDFFAKADKNIVEDIPEADFGDAVVDVEETTKRRRKKTRESTEQMLEETENVNNSIMEKSQEGIKEYRFPPISLLKSSKNKGTASSDAAIRDTAIKLKNTLENFGVKVTVTDYSCGPSVTRYELQPEQGVKVSKIVGLADDIKLNLAAADIRIEAPIPGKAAIGIEVPNKESQAVYFRDLLESDKFQKFNSNIAFAVGKDISGQVVVADIAKMPHLLVAGATGSGKSVCINTLIMSILYKANPNDVKLIMVDPKQVELSIYNGIPHMLIPVVTDPKKAAGALNWAVMEMTNRYQLFSQYNVRNLQGYNEKVKAVTGLEEGNEELKKLPQIIIIVDELADLMMVAHGEVEEAIVRLSQLARAAGIHLVIATQRPSVDVITGLIKANVPSRIAMTVSSGVDSRTILDMNGAEKLLGKGDMLFYPTGYPKPVRVQGAFLSDDEIANVVDFLKEQSGEVVYDDSITDEINSSASGSSSKNASVSEVDDYFADAGRFIIGKEKASIGMLQRVYKIGFNRAARIMDQLCEAGVVGEDEGTKPRKVLMTMEEFENYVEENL